jgi:hypothetical protein
LQHHTHTFLQQTILLRLDQPWPQHVDQQPIAEGESAPLQLTNEMLVRFLRELIGQQRVIPVDGGL